MVLGHDTRTSERTRDIKITEDVSFDSMLLSPKTMQGLKASGFHVPSPIQLHGIPLGKCGFDLLLEAKSGTGKTAVFSVIALEKLDLDKGIQALVLAPTREIASQIHDVIKTIGAYYKGLSVEVVMGGLPVADNIEKLNKRVHIVVGSPGRLHHLIKDKLIDVSAVRLMVLDEADKLMEKSFLSDVNHIFSLLPTRKQIIMSSATYPANVKTIMSKYVQNAHHICPDSNSVLLGIEQYVILVPRHVNIVKQTKNRYMELIRILCKTEFKQCLVFCNYQVRVGEVHRMLYRDEWPADKLYGQQEQTERLEALKILQNYQCRILVTTDLAARGIDASNVDLVINFEIPYSWETYLHRIGRAGRYGSYGSAVSIVCGEDEKKEFSKLLEAINIPFDLKYFWGKETFLKSCKSNKFNHKDKTKLNVLKTEIKLGVKETYEELWKMLSLDTTELVDNGDIPTFKSLCDSYKQVNAKSKFENNEKCSELIIPLANDQSGGNKQPNFFYKNVKVNNLIIPSTIFNPNVILQSFKKDQEDETNAETNNNDYKYKNDDTKLNQCEIDSVDLCSDQISEPEEKNENGKIELNISNQKIKSNQKCISNKNEEKISSINDNANVNTEHGSFNNGHVNGFIENKQRFHHINYHQSLPSTSGISKYKISTGSTQKNLSSKDHYKSPTKPVSYKIASSRINDYHQQSESDSSDNYSAKNYNSGKSYECNINKEKSSKNLPAAFSKCNQWKSSQSKKHNKVSVNKNSRRIHNKDSEQQFNKIQRQYSENHESSKDEKNHDLSFSHRILKGKASTENRNDSQNNIKYSGLGNHNSEIQARQYQFNLWYQQLQAHMEMIERSVYIEVMSKPYL